MPVMGGIEAAHHIRQGINRQTPVIALTADVFTTRQYDLQQSGIDDYLFKPVTEQGLIDMLDRWGGPGARALSAQAVSAPSPASDSGKTPDDAGLPPGFDLRLYQELRTRLRALREACAAGDEAAAGEQLHQLKGIVEYFKPVRFHTLYRELNAAILSGDAVTREAVFDRIEDLLAQLPHV